MSEIYIGENGNWYINGVDTGKPSRGEAGLSAYHIAVSYGYKGNMFEWINDLKGDSAYHLAVKAGYAGTEEEWLRSLEGVDGLTPQVGENGNWYIGDEDTGILADAEKAVEERIVASTDIKEEGKLMDGKTLSEALGEINRKYVDYIIVKKTYTKNVITGQMYFTENIVIPDGYKVVSAWVRTFHASTLCGMPMVSEEIGKISIPYIATTTQNEEFRCTLFCIKDI